MTPTEETTVYVRQIRMACSDPDSAEFMVMELLREYAAKVYRAARVEMAEEIARLAVQCG